MEGKISIIVPIYNVEGYLVKSINSILNQSYKNIEVILVDDGSTDNSSCICDEFSLKDNRIKVIHKKNEGVSIARNIGITKSTGEYIAFVDADDWVDEDIYLSMYEAINEHNTDLVMSKFTRVYPNGKFEVSNEPLESGIYNKDKIFDKLIIPMIANDFSNISDTLIMGSIWRCLYKAERIKSNYINFKNVKIAEDMLFHLNYLAVSTSVYVLDNSLYYYRYNNLSATNNYIENLWETLTRQLELLENILRKFNLLNDLSKERLDVNMMCFVSWCFKNESNPQNTKEYKTIIKDMKKISTYDKYKSAFKWSNIIKVPLKERILYICIKLKFYNLVYKYHNKKFKELVYSN